VLITEITTVIYKYFLALGRLPVDSRQTYTQYGAMKMQTVFWLKFNKNYYMRVIEFRLTHTKH
jgi:hypothetical protein